MGETESENGQLVERLPVRKIRGTDNNSGRSILLQLLTEQQHCTAAAAAAVPLHTAITSTCNISVNATGVQQQ